MHSYDVIGLSLVGFVVIVAILYKAYRFFAQYTLIKKSVYTALCVDLQTAQAQVKYYYDLSINSESNGQVKLPLNNKIRRNNNGGDITLYNSQGELYKVSRHDVIKLNSGMVYVERCFSSFNEKGKEKRTFTKLWINLDDASFNNWRQDTTTRSWYQDREITPGLITNEPAPQEQVDLFTGEPVKITYQTPKPNVDEDGHVWVNGKKIK